MKTVVGVILVGVVVVLALIAVPARDQAKELTIAPGSVASATISIPGPSWVTVHFDRHGNEAMSYWMDGPSGMMFNRSMMNDGGMMGSGHGSDSYSFWTWGGDFRCGAALDGSGSAVMPVWFNTTSGLL